jgi:methylmalonyl-CoA/ethylmalonyl-CoA epimerase
VIEYPNEPPVDGDRSTGVTAPGITHVGLVCDDIEATRAAYQAAGVTFLTDGIADVAGLRTTWFVDPWGVVFILLEKGRRDRPYWRQL